MAAWHAEHGGGRVDVALSALGMLMLTVPPAAETQRYVRGFDELSDAGFARAASDVWNRFLAARPDLGVPAWPLIRVWLPASTDGAVPAGEQETTAAAALARAAVRAGVYDLLAGPARYQVDLPGALLTALRPAGARQTLGQFLTPPDIAELMARMVGVREQAAVKDPACGTGGLFRATAAVMRANGDDPASVTWVGADLDELAVAACAVNAVSWELGPLVALGCGDALAHPQLMGAILAEHDHILRVAAIARAMRAIPTQDCVRDGRPQ